MEGNRQGKRTAGDFRGLESRSVDAVDDAAEEEFIPDHQAEINRGGIQVHPTGPTEVGSQRSFESPFIEVDSEAPRPDAERPTVQVHVPREGTNCFEVPGGEFFADQVRKAQPMDGTLERADRIDSQDLTVKGGDPDVHAFRLEGGEGLRPRQGGMLARQFDEGAHVGST